MDCRERVAAFFVAGSLAREAYENISWTSRFSEQFEFRTVTTSEERANIGS